MSEGASVEDTARHRWRPTPNPVLRRELVERWRGRRAFVVLTVYLSVLTGMMLLLLWAGSTAIDNGIDAGPALGRFLLENVLGLVLLLVLFVGPGYAAAQIAQERERRTLSLLQITLVTPWRIVAGKLGAASAWLLLLVVSAAPMAATGFFLGGVSIGDLLRGVAYIVLVTVSVAAIGIGVSAMVRRTVAAVVITYGIVLLLVGGTVFGAIIEMVVTADDFEDRPVLLTANPFLGLADAVRTSEIGAGLPSMLTPFGYALPVENSRMGMGRGVMIEERAVVDGRVAPGPAVGPVLDAPVAVEPNQPLFDEGPDRQPVWLRTLAIHMVLAAGALVLATRRVRPGQGPGPRRRGGRGGGTRVLQAPADGPPPPMPPPPPSGPPTPGPPKGAPS